MFCLDLALDERGEISGVSFLEFRAAPICAGHTSATVRLFTVAFKFIVIRIVAHGVIEGDLVARFDVAHGDQAGRSAQPCVRITAMVEAIRGVAEKRIKEEQFFFNLKDTFGKVRDGRVDLIYGDDSSAPKDEYLMFGNRLAGDDAAPALFMKWSGLQFGTEVGEKWFVHSLILFCGWE